MGYGALCSPPSSHSLLPLVRSADQHLAAGSGCSKSGSACRPRILTVFPHLHPCGGPGQTMVVFVQIRERNPPLGDRRPLVHTRYTPSWPPLGAHSQEEGYLQKGCPWSFPRTPTGAPACGKGRPADPPRSGSRAVQGAGRRDRRNWEQDCSEDSLLCPC